MHNTVCIAVLHEQWMCLGIQRNTHITGNNLIPISVPILPIAYEGEGRDGYRDQIVTCDVGVSLNSLCVVCPGPIRSNCARRARVEIYLAKLMHLSM